MERKKRTIHVLVVDDSAFMRQMISTMLNEDPRIRVVGIARNGEDALKKQKRLQPDVITLDVEMPVMNGLETLRKIMQDSPCPVVMVSGESKKGEKHTLLAMEYGAVDFISKPSIKAPKEMETIKEELITKVLQAAKANVLPIQKRSHKDRQRQPAIVSKKKESIVAIGTSTGGPRALKNIVTKLPKTIDAPILIVQHMPAGFTHSLAERLNSLSFIRVKEAKHGEKIKKATAYIAPGNFHLGVKQIGSSLYVELNKEEPIRGHRPAVDYLFQSLASLDNIQMIPIILTGMGTDGAKGLQLLKNAHPSYAIAEDESSCVVYGMPKAAVRTGLIDEVLPNDQIADRLVSLLQSR